ncbi:glycoside hydrolase family 5 protein [Xylariomycetidae sp. FL0641]|nr:glycoside hydrolase family 5 protein [Xylariomycetidae sp. FL0641]
MGAFKLVRLLAVLLPFLSNPVSARGDGRWPLGPFNTSGRWITDVEGTTFTYAGVNWPASVDTMVPEGLQYQSIDEIVAKIKSLGMNAIRLTYATEMIDQYFDNGQTDISIQEAFIDALGEEDGQALLDKVIEHNPSMKPDMGRLEVFERIMEVCWDQMINVHLDNHISKAGWCCNPTDGNSWWGDEHFSVSNWTRGLKFMAEKATDWPTVASMSLRNELRIPLTNLTLASNSYNWEDWYSHVKQGADAIHSANPDLLIFVSGMSSDQDLSQVVQGTALVPGTGTFNKDDFSGHANKLVLELHSYDNILGTPSSNCSETQETLFQNGFEALTNDATNQFPVVLSEFGFAQNETLVDYPYANCLLDFVSQQHAGWMIWELSGSHYIREGTQDDDEKWGLLAHDWSDWRAPDFINDKLAPAVNATLENDGEVPPSPGSGGSKTDSGDDDKHGSSSRMAVATLGMAVPWFVAIFLMAA